MNLVTLGLGGAALITLGLLAPVPGAGLSSACIDFSAPTVAITFAAPTVVVSVAGPTVEIDFSADCP